MQKDMSTVYKNWKSKGVNAGLSMICYVLMKSNPYSFVDQNNNDKAIVQQTCCQ